MLPRHDYTSPLSFEHIDVATGSLVLTFTDLVLTGNAGRELRFQRTYNSKELGGGAWTFGIAGVPMGVYFVGPVNGPGVPTFMMPDGGIRSTPLELGTPPTPILEYTGNESFWVYEASTSTLKMPDGTVCVFGSRGLSYFSDPFGNTVQLLYDYPAVDQVTVRQTLGGTEFRDVVLTYAPATQQSLPTDLPLSMSFQGRAWTYGTTSATLPEGLQWGFTPETDGLTVTTPQGGQVTYEFETKQVEYPDGTNSSTRMLHFRRADANDGNGFKTWEYIFDQPGGSAFSKTTVVEPPDAYGAIRRVVFDFVNSTSGGLDCSGHNDVAPSLRVRTQAIFADATEREVEERGYTCIPVRSSNSADAAAELTSRTITRHEVGGDRTFTHLSSSQLWGLPPTLDDDRGRQRQPGGACDGTRLSARRVGFRSGRPNVRRRSPDEGNDHRGWAVRA